MVPCACVGAAGLGVPGERGGATLAAAWHGAVLDLDEAEARALAARLRPFTAEAGEVRGGQGAPADRLFMVDEGRLDAHVAEADGTSELLSSVGPGDHLGEMALNHAMLRLATITAARADARAPAAGGGLRGAAHGAGDRGRSRCCCGWRGCCARGCGCARRRSRGAGAGGAGTRAGGVRRPQPGRAGGAGRAAVARVLQGDFADDELRALRGCMRRWQIPRGRRVTTAGTPGSVGCVIASGAVEISVKRGERRQQLAVVGPGKMFGMVSLIDGGPRRTTCTAREDAVLLELRARGVRARSWRRAGRWRFA
jgi:CRP-like cAMP-binding protein